MSVKLTGKLFEVGNIDGGRGIRIEKDGEDIAITGMTIDECRLAGTWFGEDVEITITKVRL